MRSGVRRPVNMGDQESRAGSGYSTARISEYCDRLHTGSDAALLRAFDAPEANEMPAIMVGQSEAKFLQLLVQIHRPMRVVEVGTLAGFSAISMAQALPAGGHIWTLENEAKHAEVARDNIAHAGLSEEITVILGDALEGLDKIKDEGPFDLVFLDADKERYDLYQDWSSVHLRAGGLLLADNAYYFGHLLDQTEDAAAVRRMHEKTATGFDSVCIPTPDGLVMGIKRG